MKAAYLPWYVRDWRSDPKVQLLPWEERALYRDMIDLSWELGPLPDDLAAVIRALGAPDRLTECVGGILARFWTKTAAGWKNPRLERERKRTKELLERRSDLGKKGAAARWGSDAGGNADGNAYGIACGIADGNARGMPRAPEPEPEPFPDPDPKRVDSASLRSAEGASAPGLLPGLEIRPPKGKREPSQKQVDGFVARGVWQRCWREKFGTDCTGLEGHAAGALRTAFARLKRDEGELERLVRKFLDAPPFKHQEIPDAIAFLASLDAVRAGLNGKGRNGRAPTQDERNRESLRQMAEWAKDPT